MIEKKRHWTWSGKNNLAIPLPLLCIDLTRKVFKRQYKNVPLLFIYIYILGRVSSERRDAYSTRKPFLLTFAAQTAAPRL